jgi:hypothetical protein
LEETARIRTAFESLVAAAATDESTRIVTSESVSRLGDGLFSPASAPVEDVQWLECGGFECQPPQGYGWTSPSTPEDGRFEVIEDAAAAGQRGLRVVVEGAADYAVQRRVDIDKGRLYDVSAAVRGDDVGEVTLTLQPVVHRPNGLEPVGPGFTTRPLSGSFDWTPLAATGYVASNHDYVRVTLRVAGGGTVDVDDVAVRSQEPMALAFPAEVAQPVLIGALIHVEDVPDLTWQSPYFEATTQVLEDVAELYHRHGAALTVQPEMELLDGVTTARPDLVRHLHEDLGCGFSVHTHGPGGSNPSDQEVLDYVAERKSALEDLGAGKVHDLNGSFDLPDYSVLSEIGIYSMTAFKNKYTQAAYEGRYFQPWRPSAGNPFVDETAWAVDDPTSRVVYLPGGCTTLTRYRDHVARNLLPGLTAALWNTDSELPTTWYFVMHVDFFKGTDGSPRDAYLQSSAYAEDLAAYDEMLSDVLDPLVSRGFLRWATPNEMREAFEAAVGLRAPESDPRQVDGRGDR